jgi:hypothetical protein
VKYCSYAPVVKMVELAFIDSMEAVRSTVLMHYMHKAGGWQPKAAGGWFALLTPVHKTGG